MDKCYMGSGTLKAEVQYLDATDVSGMTNPENALPIMAATTLANKGIDTRFVDLFVFDPNNKMTYLLEITLPKTPDKFAGVSRIWSAFKNKKEDLPKKKENTTLHVVCDPPYGNTKIEKNYQIISMKGGTIERALYYLKNEKED